MLFFSRWLRVIALDLTVSLASCASQRGTCERANERSKFAISLSPVSLFPIKSDLNAVHWTLGNRERVISIVAFPSMTVARYPTSPILFAVLFTVQPFTASIMQRLGFIWPFGSGGRGLSMHRVSKIFTYIWVAFRINVSLLGNFNQTSSVEGIFWDWYCVFLWKRR